MNIRQIREMNTNELELELEDLHEEYFNLRYQKRMNRLEDTSKLSEVRKNIARIKTLINEKKNG
ncbi:MAG: 50S ribosomal protein L29 [Candidatus Cloacimonetes bacterium]|nr:50S ribosomal protein L29 [Candidatus Cloacimonadota bacterium]MBS3766922.1 50S ribosomal protein L29 [Candidatus Cloacimonadota bacterium]